LAILPLLLGRFWQRKASGGFALAISFASSFTLAPLGRRAGDLWATLRAGGRLEEGQSGEEKLET